MIEDLKATECVFGKSMWWLRPAVGPQRVLTIAISTSPDCDRNHRHRLGRKRLDHATMIRQSGVRKVPRGIKVRSVVADSLRECYKNLGEASQPQIPLTASARSFPGHSVNGDGRRYRDGHRSIPATSSATDKLKARAIFRRFTREGFRSPRSMPPTYVR